MGNIYEERAEWEKTLTAEAKRCLDCAYLVEDGEGEWVCDDCGKPVQEIMLGECPNSVDEDYYTPPRLNLYERTRSAVYATGNRWAIENFHATHD